MGWCWAICPDQENIVNWGISGAHKPNGYLQLNFCVGTNTILLITHNTNRVCTCSVVHSFLLSGWHRYGHASLPGSTKMSHARQNCGVSYENYDGRSSRKVKVSCPYSALGKKLEIVHALELCKQLLVRNSELQRLSSLTLGKIVT